MSLTRRAFVASSLALVAPFRSWTAQALDIGEGRSLITLSDGHLVLPGDFILGGMPAEELAQIVARHGLDLSTEYRADCNLALYQDGARRVLFDVGAGPDFMPSAGHIEEALDAAGLSPDDITDVIFTHGHPDHLWGLLDDFDEPVFANADYHMGAEEFRYWTDPDTVESIGAARQSFAVGAARRLAEIADRIVLFDDGDEVLPGIEAVLTPGHTPGHMAFHVAGPARSAMVVGDAIGNHHVAFARPEWISGSDQDGALAAETRLSLFDRMLSDDLAIIGFHLPGGGIGQVARHGDGFAFEGEG